MDVRFGAALATGVTVVSATQATALAPAHAAGDVDVSVTTPGGTATLSSAYTYVAAPSLTDVSPNEGPATGGQSVTLTGTNFRSGMQVRFGGTVATLGSVHPSGTLATVTTPAHAAGAVNVSVMTPGGSTTLASGYTYVDAPTLTAIAPQVGPIGGGTSVTLTGSGFRAGMEVRFGGTLAAVESVDSDGASATVTTPAHAAGAGGRLGHHARRHRDARQRLHLRGGADPDRRVAQRGTDRGWAVGDRDRHRLPPRHAGAVRR